ncbi:MAG: hypothetical protein ABI408_09025 [Gemmatimonadaceae bacterium]
MEIWRGGAMMLKRAALGVGLTYILVSDPLRLGHRLGGKNQPARDERAEGDP